MTSSSSDSRADEDTVAAAIARLYRGPLEDFVRGRDALARELRSAGNREAASNVKTLRKPSRIAWALNLGGLDRQESVDPLVAAVTATLDAQASGRDVRAAITGLRTAVRRFADHAAHAAEGAGHAIEPATLATAVLAVLGRQESFDQLRAGCLAAVPEGGGLDLLAGLPAPSEPGPARAAAHGPATTPTVSAERAAAEAGRRAAAEAATRRAAAVLADARVREQAAQQALRDAEAQLRAAEAQLRRAAENERAARKARDRADAEADAAAARVLEAANALAEAERQITPTGG